MSERPDPDALLAQVHETERPAGRGRLKVYLGMAAGVGKTYSMLSDAQEAKKRGEDVAIGYLEPHGRAETEAMSAGLERLPLRQIDHRGVTLKEFDLDQALERHPDLLLVDELAHTNAPGSRHRKRWQDVLELLAAGINVYTTVNTQHLESLNDVVAQITGVIVAETVPDALVDEADEVELVDLPPEELLNRLQEGKIYIPEKVDQALKGFFKKGNLLALRELSLRHTAERVDEQVRTYRAAEGTSNPWATRERILVCIAPNKLGSRVVRAAKRMATALHGDLIAVFVESGRQASLSEADRQLAAEALQLAESLGAETVTLNGQDIVSEVIRFAQTRNVTTIVVGKPVRPRWREFLFGSVVDSMVRSSGDIDVHVITGSSESGTRLRVQRPEHRHDWAGYVIGLIVTGIATAACWAMQDHFAPANLIMVYLMGVAIVASTRSSRAAMLTSLLSVAAYDFFFVHPTGTFEVSDAEYLVTFAVMFSVALLISTLAGRLRLQSVAASEREHRTAALFELSKKLSSTRSRTEISVFAAEQVRDVFQCDSAVLIKGRKTGKLFIAAGSNSWFERDVQENAVASWVMDNGRRAGKGTDTLPGSKGLYLPLNAERGCVGVLAIVNKDKSSPDPSQFHFLETFANQLAVAIERTNLAKDSHEASLTVEQERLRNSLLSSVSHDLRTPLAVISGAAESLLQASHLGEERERELVAAIADESQRLERQVRNLLDMTRIEAGAIELRREWQSVEELVGSALYRTESLLKEHVVTIDIAPEMPLLQLDGVLMEQVFVNLLENAAKHTPTGTAVNIQGRKELQTAVIEISNNGPSLSPEDLKLIFLKFHQRGKSGSGGFGLGLAICQAIVSAHQGTILATTPPGGGVTFTIHLPLSKNQPEVPLD